MPDFQEGLTYTQRLSRAIDEAYEGYRPGEPDAEESLYMALLAQARNIVNYRLGWGQTTEVVRDIARRGFMAVLSFRGDCRFSTWFYGLALNESNRALRERIVNRERFVPIFTDDEEGEEQELQIEAKPMDLDTHIQFEQACKRLSPAQAVVLESMAEGYSLEEIARKEGKPLGTIRSRYRLAKDRLNSKREEEKVTRQ